MCGELCSVKDECISISEQYETLYVTDKVFRYISDVTNPQGILAVIQKEENQIIDYQTDFVLILDDIQDPGNLGTILRTVDSVGLSQVIVSRDTVDIYNSKVIRSTMGANFRVKVIEADDLLETIYNLKQNGFEIIATDLHTENTIYNLKMKKIAMIIGNEANGVSKEILKVSDKKVKIPMLRKNRKFKCGSSNWNYFI